MADGLARPGQAALNGVRPAPVRLGAALAAVAALSAKGSAEPRARAAMLRTGPGETAVPAVRFPAERTTALLARPGTRSCGSSARRWPSSRDQPAAPSTG
ncbi:MAG TPA: hypothetical protein VN714_04645 [Trebonia sp.]|nr:hypothetical protein [Trebonia sp.]